MKKTKDKTNDINPVLDVEFDDGTKLKIAVFNGRLTKTKDVYFINESSPLAKALMNKKKGERVKYISEGKPQQVTKIDIKENFN